jgi:Arc/MetJ family transcription regulator
VCSDLLRRKTQEQREMNKTVEIDDELVREVQAATGEQTEQQAVEQVLRRFLEARRKHADLLDLVGKVRFRDDYDPRTVRFSGHDAG